MANKLYEEKDVARIAGGINSYTGQDKAYKLSEMADAVAEISNITISLIDRSAKRLVIPPKVSFIGQHALSGFGRCLEFDFTAHTSVPELASSNAFGQLNRLAKILIPADLYDEWISSPGWSELTEYIVPTSSEGFYFASPDGEEYILDSRGSCYDAFIVMPDSYNGCPVTGISSYMFRYDISLEAIYLSKNIKIIIDSPFIGCNNLKKIYMLGVESLYSITMCDMPALEYVLFGKHINYLGGSAFSGSGTGAFFDFSACRMVPQLNSYGAGAEFGTNPVIGVPADLYDEWISSTNWSLYESNIVAIYKVPEIPDPGYVSEGLEIGIDEFVGAPVVMGRGTCTDSVIVIPDECYGIGTEAFINDKTVDTVILPQRDCYFYEDCFLGSTLRVVKNFTRIGWSFSLGGTDNLKIVSFIDGAAIDNYDFYYLVAQGITYDFTRCTSVVNLTDPEYITVDKDTKILVPVSLYGEWIKATNWAGYADKIYPAK